jgi:acyl carrier protein
MSDQIAIPSIEHDVRQIIEEVIATGPAAVAPDTDLFNSGIIDSFNMIEIIEHLEERFLIGFAIEDLSLQNFGTVTAIANTVRRYQKQASAA